MKTITKKKSTSLRLKTELYKEVQERAKQENRSVNNYLEMIISNAVHYHEPNKKTKKALNQAMTDRPYRNYKSYNTKEGLLKDLLSDE